MVAPVLVVAAPAAAARLSALVEGPAACRLAAGARASCRAPAVARAAGQVLLVAAAPPLADWAEGACQGDLVARWAAWAAWGPTVPWAWVCLAVAAPAPAARG